MYLKMLLRLAHKSKGTVNFITVPSPFILFCKELLIPRRPLQRVGVYFLTLFESV